MSKYYNKKIPIEINVVYGGRQSGKTYYEFNKIKQENIRLKEELKTYKYYYNLISKRCNLLKKELEQLVSNSDISEYNAEKLENILKIGK